MSSGLGYGRIRLIEKIVNLHWEIKDPRLRQYTYNELLFILQELLEEEGRPYQEGNFSAIRGHAVFRKFTEYLLYRNLANYDSMILLTSEKGTGKSSAAMMLARYWCSLIGIRFNPSRHIAYNNADVMNKIDSLNKFEPIIADESIRFASSEDWNKKENKELKKKLGQVRTKHLLYILCFPLKLYKLEKTYLESYVNYWIDLFGRGVGACYVKDRNPVLDTWRTKDFRNVGSYTEFTSLNQVRDKLKKHPNFWQIVRFPKPPKWLYTKYLKVREMNVYDDENVLANVSKEDIQRALLILALRDIMKNDINLTMNRIILHINNEFDIKLTKAQIQDIINDSKQLVTKVRETAQY